MSDILERAREGGVDISFVNGNIVVKVDADKLAATREIDTPAIKVYEIPATTLVGNVVAEVKRIPKNLKKAKKKIFGKPKGGK